MSWGKRIVLFLMVLCIAGPSLAYAAGTASVTSWERITVLRENQRLILTITWTDDTNGTTLAFDPKTYGIEGWYLIQAETVPGSTAPTNNYDIYLYTADNFDLAIGTLVNRSETLAQRVSVYSSTIAYPVMLGSITFTLSGNAVNNATGTLKLIFSAN